MLRRFLGGPFKEENPWASQKNHPYIIHLNIALSMVVSLYCAEKSHMFQIIYRGSNWVWTCFGSGGRPGNQKTRGAHQSPGFEEPCALRSCTSRLKLRAELRQRRELLRRPDAAPGVVGAAQNQHLRPSGLSGEGGRRFLFLEASACWGGGGRGFLLAAIFGASAFGVTDFCPPILFSGGQARHWVKRGHVPGKMLMQCHCLDPAADIPRQVQG